jgi:hypothetical protein
METINITKETKERFIAYMGILQHARKKNVTQDDALNALLDSSWKHFQEDFKTEPPTDIPEETKGAK